MKRILFGLLLAVALLFGIALPEIPVLAAPLIAQANPSPEPQPAPVVTPQRQPQAQPTAQPSPAPQPTPAAKATPTLPPDDDPYGIEAMKAFNRALYGS
jgi:hypothetical protein